MIIAASEEPLRDKQIYLKTISAFCARSNPGRTECGDDFNLRACCVTRHGRASARHLSEATSTASPTSSASSSRCISSNPALVEAKLRQIDFGSFIADWLRDRKRSEDLARFALRLLPEAVAATENSGLMMFVSRRITAQLMSIDLAPLAAGTLRAFVREGRHQGLLDDILRAVHQTLTQAETMAMIREKIRAELPTLLKLYRADKFLVNKIVASASAFFEEVRNDPETSVSRRVRSHGVELRRPPRHRSGLCRAHRRA